ncbi:MAG: SspB family protein [Rhizobiaceae bacterium]
MTQDMIRYDILAQDALRGVIRKVLMEVNRTGLPGNHHFFITFVTTAPGVRISSRLREKYPEQMTIVMQHQYWDLDVSETGFEVTLSFSDISEKLVIPYAAIRGFYDPSVNFELEFEVRSAAADTLTETDIVPAGPVLHEVIKAPLKPRAVKSKAEKAAAKKAEPEDGKPSADVVSLDSFRKK